MPSSLPSGTVTFLFTDVEGSTRLLHELGGEAYARELAEHRRVIRDACAREQGVEVDTQGDAFFFAFSNAPGALAAAGELTRALASGPIQVRIGLHTGTPHLTSEGYVGEDVHRAARIAAAGHGGQVLVSASTASLVETDALRDLGEHRFKDLALPERVYQVGHDDFPALKSLYRTNLPVPATPFLGREREVREVADLLAREEVRLLTLAGPGGTGKTRLALQAAAESAHHFPDGVFWVPLAPVRDPALVPVALAQALEVGEQPGRDPTETIVGMFAAKRALVLIDNCEHLASAVAPVVATFIQGSPAAVVAASSRERLGLRAERVYAVQPMQAADGEALFMERARVVRADFASDEHVPAICAAVDRLPLAIELAAARVRSLSTQAIRERLRERLSVLTTRDRDVDERQRTLEATIAWSYELLDDAERRALRALSVFAGGCTLEAAHELAGADLDLLESLLDKSLLRHRIDRAGQDRYWMLETIREFSARELERESEAEDIRNLHAQWTLELIRRVAPRWGDPAPREAMDRVLADEGNIRIALELALEQRAANRALELVGLVGRTWVEAGRFIEMETWARATLALDGGDSRLEGMALLTRGAGSGRAYRAHFEAAADRFRAAEMPREAAYATMCLGFNEGEAGAVDLGLDLLETALTEFERLDDEYLIGVARTNIVYLQSLRWPLEPRAARLIADRARQAVEVARRMGDPGDEVASLEILSSALIEAGELTEARSAVQLAARLFKEAGAGATSILPVVSSLARCAGLSGDAEQALMLAGAVRSVGNELGHSVPVTRLAALEAVEAACRDTLDRETAARATALGEAMNFEALLEYLEGLGSQT